MLERQNILLGSRLAFAVVGSVITARFVVGDVGFNAFGCGGSNAIGITAIPAGVTTARGGGYRTSQAARCNTLALGDGTNLVSGQYLTHARSYWLGWPMFEVWHVPLDGACNGLAARQNDVRSFAWFPVKAPTMQHTSPPDAKNGWTVLHNQCINYLSGSSTLIGYQLRGTHRTVSRLKA